MVWCKKWNKLTHNIDSNNKPLNKIIMTLEELIQQNQTEDYKFFKHHEKDGKEVTTHIFFEAQFDNLGKYLGFYKDLPNMTEVIVLAGDGIFVLTNQSVEYIIRPIHLKLYFEKNGNHSGIPNDVSEQVRKNLIRQTKNFLNANTFDEIFNTVAQCKVNGFDDLSIYETARRIALYLNIDPKKSDHHKGVKNNMVISDDRGSVEIGSSNTEYTN
jgi:hypothetical protein